MLTNRLKGKIAESGYSYRTLADMMNMSKNTVYAKINGKSQFNTKEVQDLCAILHLTDLKEMAEIFLTSSSQN